MRVRLELRDLPRFSLFRGQFLCVQGQNPSGHCLVARGVVAAAPPPMPTSPVSSPAFGALSMAIASGAVHVRGRPRTGPSTRCSRTARPRDRMSSSSSALRRRRAQDDRGGDDSASPGGVFRGGVRVRRSRPSRFLDASADAGHAPSVVLMPSAQRAHGRVFRNLPFSPTGRWRRQRGVVVACAPNPGTFTVNGVRVMACTQDVLRHLSAAEAARDAAPGGDRMARLVAHPRDNGSAYRFMSPPARDAAWTPRSRRISRWTSRRTSCSSRRISTRSPRSCPGRRRTRRRRTRPARGEDASAEDAFVAVNPGRLARGNVGGRSRACTSPRGRPNPGRAGNSRTSSPNARGSISCACERDGGRGRRGGRRGAESFASGAKTRLSRKRRARGRERRRLDSRAVVSTTFARTPM